MRPVTSHFRLGVEAGLRNLRLVALQAGLDLLATLLGTLPVALAALLVVRHVLRSAAALPFTLQPLEVLGVDLLRYLSSTDFLYPVVGLAVSGALLTGVLRYAYYSGALAVLARDVEGEKRPPVGTFMDAMLTRFHDTVLVGVLAFFASVLSISWTVVTLGSALVLYLRGSASGVAAGLGGAAALAFGYTAAIMLAAGYEAVVRIALVRVVVFSERATIGIYEGMLMLLRRPGELILLGLLIVFAQVAVALTVGLGTATSSFGSPELAMSMWGSAASGVGTVIQVTALACVAVVAQGALVAFVLDDAGRLPEPPLVPSRPDPRPRQPIVRAEIVRETEPVHAAEQVIVAKVVTDSERPTGERSDENGGTDDSSAS